MDQGRQTQGIGARVTLYGGHTDIPSARHSNPRRKDAGRSAAGFPRVRLRNGNFPAITERMRLTSPRKRAFLRLCAKEKGVAALSLATR